MANIRSSLVITFFSSNGATAVQFLVTVILARLLEPSEIGIYSITAVCISVAHIFRDFGVVSYLQREKELTREKVGAAFGVLLSSSWVIAILMWALSATVANYYRMPGMENVMHVLALGFVFIPFGAITNCLLTRDYRAKEQAYVRVAGTLTYAITVLVLAYNGFSYMAMAWANLANIVATALAFMPFRTPIEPWLPRFNGWGKVVNFGAGATIGNSLVAVNNAIPDVVLGKLSGAHDVGIMSRSLSTPNLINQLIGPTVGYAVLPYLARAHHNGEGVSASLAKGIAYLTAIQWPAYLAIAVYAEPLILVLYGPKWLDCAPIVQVICLALVAGTPFSFDQNAYMAIGRPYLSSVPTGASILLKLVCVYTLYANNLASFAWAFVVAAVCMYPLQIGMQKFFLDLKPTQSLKAQWTSVPLAMASTATAWAAHQLTVTWPAIAQLLLAAVAVPAAWLTAIWWLKHPLKSEIRLLTQRVPLLNRL